jgi:hypothetical protein
VLKAAVHDGPHELGLQEEVLEARGVDAYVALLGWGLPGLSLASLIICLLLVVHQLLRLLLGQVAVESRVRHLFLLVGDALQKVCLWKKLHRSPCCVYRQIWQPQYL